MATDTSLAGQALRMTAAEVAVAVGGTLVTGARETPVAGVSTDSRTTARGNLFVALSGETFDGHDYVGNAAWKGAAAALVAKSKMEKAREAGIALIAVEEKETLPALGRLGRAWRDRLEVPVVGITGSAGKSTAKEMTAAVLGGSSRNVLKTEGNLNNRIGVPLTLLSVLPEHTAAVVEMGISFPGEMAELVGIAMPTVRVLLNAGLSHVEFLKDADGVAAEKAHIWDQAGPDDTMVFNRDDERVAREAGKRTLRNRLSFGVSPGADVRAVEVSPLSLGEQRIHIDLRGAPQEITLKAVGEHHVMNALAAAAVGCALRVGPEEIARGLSERFTPVPGRGDVIRLENDVLLVDDSYNANPSSTAAALTALGAARKSGRKRAFAALGDMLELGPLGPGAHTRMGQLAAEEGIDALYLYGPLATARLGAGAEGAGLKKVLRFEKRPELSVALLAALAPGDVVLVKGSRGMRMDEVVSALVQARGGKK